MTLSGFKKIQQSTFWKVLLFMLPWAFLEALVSISMQAINSTSLDEIELSKPLIGCLRTGIQLLILFSWKWGLQRVAFPKRYAKLFLLRAFLGFLAICATYEAYARVNITILTAFGFLEYGLQLILSAVFLGLVLRRRTLFWIILGYIGIFGIKYYMAGGENKMDTYIFWGLSMSVLANVLAAVAKVLTKRFQGFVENDQLLLYGSLFLFPFFLVSALPYRAELQLISQRQVCWLLVLSLCSLIARYFYLKALTYGHFDLLVPMSYLKVIGTLYLAPFLLANNYFPDRYILLGIAVILISNYFAVRTASTTPQPNQAPPPEEKKIGATKSAPK